MFSLLSVPLPHFLCPRLDTLCLNVQVLPGHQECPTTPPTWQQTLALVSAETLVLGEESSIPTGNSVSSLLSCS